MGLFTVLYIVLTIKSWEASSITNVRNFRRHAGPPPPANWELGLRESVHQALLREHYTEPTLREQLLEAPFIGRHDNASPFGDIAVLARGQLYITSEGFKFVQDSEEDCEDCLRHNSCRSPCQPWKGLGHHYKLLALWTVKRIRHRDPNYGHVFEIEYTISPITQAINEELVRRHGHFDYNVPGHIFVIKSDPQASSGYHLNAAGDKWYKNQATEQYPHGSGQFKPGILIGVSPDGYKHVLHSFPGFYSSYHPQATYHDQTTIDPKEYELYKKLIESLASKTTPHRFTLTTTKEKTNLPATSPTYPTGTTFQPVPQTTLLQLVPLTEKTAPVTTTQVQIVTHPQESDVFYHTTTKVPTLQPPKPITVPVTTIHYYTPVEVPPETVRTTEASKASTVTTWRPQKTTQDDFDLFPVITPTEPMKPATELPQRTRPDSINEQLPPPGKDTDTTIPYVSTTVTEPTTQRKTFATSSVTPKATTVSQRTFVPSTIPPKPTTPLQKEPSTATSVIERESTVTRRKTTTSPVTERITTFVISSATTPERKTTNPPLSTEAEEKTTMIIERIPYTEIKTTTLTEPDKTSTIPAALTAITTSVSTEKSVPTTQVFSTTTKLESTPTIFEYAFDSTTKEYSETTGGTTNTQTLTNTPSIYYATTEPSKFTVPTTTTHYFYTFETTLPKTSTVGTSVTETPLTRTTLPVVTTTTTQKLQQSSTIDDFLIDSEGGIPSPIDNKKDFDEDDIFGKAPPKPPTIETTTKKAYVQSDLAQALFGGRRSKQIKLSSKVRKTKITNPPKIIYTNFYRPSTQNPIAVLDTTTEFKPSTDQSYSTSISFEVNKRNDTKLHLEPTIQPKLSEVGDHDNYKIYKAELPQEAEAEKTVDTKKVFDDLALQLVNHARSIDYLHKKPSRQPKYKRRSFSTKIRRSRVQKKSSTSNRVSN